MPEKYLIIIPIPLTPPETRLLGIKNIFIPSEVINEPKTIKIKFLNLLFI